MLLSLWGRFWAWIRHFCPTILWSEPTNGTSVPLMQSVSKMRQKPERLVYFNEPAPRPAIAPDEIDEAHFIDLDTRIDHLYELGSQLNEDVTAVWNETGHSRSARLLVTVTLPTMCGKLLLQNSVGIGIGLTLLNSATGTENDVW